MTVMVGTSRGLYADGEPAALEHLEVSALAEDGDELLVGTTDGRLLRGKLDGGWDELGDTGGGRVNCLLADGPRVWVGTSGARLLCHDGESLVENQGFRSVEGRNEWFTPWGGPPDVRSFAASGATIFVNVHVGGIPRTTDSGAAWRPTIEIGSDVHQVLCSEGLVLAATAFGLALSQDGGETWASTTDGLDAHYSRAVAVSNGHILLSASTGPGGSGSALYRRRIEDDVFRRCGNGFPDQLDDNIDTHTVAARGDLVAVGAPDGHLYVSEDAGETWEIAGRGLPPISCVVVAGS
jgi:hypothetical protein